MLVRSLQGLGQRIVARRRSKGMNQKKLPRRVGVNPIALGRREQGWDTGEEALGSTGGSVPHRGTPADDDTRAHDALLATRT